MCDQAIPLLVRNSTVLAYMNVGAFESLMLVPLMHVKSPSRGEDDMANVASQHAVVFFFRLEFQRGGLDYVLECEQNSFVVFLVDVDGSLLAVVASGAVLQEHTRVVDELEIAIGIVW